MSAGSLRERVAFDRRAAADDGHGNFEGGWEPLIEPVAARIRYLVGGEEVAAQRLGGTQPAVITIRSSEATRALTTADRARDARSGKVFNIKAVTPTERRNYIDLLCVAGEAEG